MPAERQANVRETAENLFADVGPCDVRKQGDRTYRKATTGTAFALTQELDSGNPDPVTAVLSTLEHAR